MAIDFKRFNQIAPYVVATKKPVMIRGRHGIGKSEVVYQLARSVSYDTEREIHVIGSDSAGMELIERRVSQMTEGDLCGLPSIEGGRTRWNAPDFLKDACERPVMLFLDEVDRGIPEVRQGIFELTDSRKFNGWNLHPGTIIVAAVNGGEHGDQYTVGEMDPAELDRWTVFDIAPTVEDWLAFARGKVAEIVWDFINMNHAHLWHNADFEPNKVYPSPRSWFRADECFANTGFLDEDNPTEDQLDVLYHLATGYVGFEAALSFKDFVKNYDRQLSIEDVLAGRGLDKAAKWGVNEHTAMAEKLDASGRVSDDFEWTDTELENLAAYLSLVPAEVFMRFYQSFGDAQAFELVNRLHEVKLPNGVQMQLHVVRILNPNVKVESLPGLSK